MAYTLDKGRTGAGRRLLFRLRAAEVLGLGLLPEGLFEGSTSPMMAASKGLNSKLSAEAEAASASAARFLRKSMHDQNCKRAKRQWKSYSSSNCRIFLSLDQFQQVIKQPKNTLTSHSEFQTPSGLSQAVHSLNPGNPSAMRFVESMIRDRATAN